MASIEPALLNRLRYRRQFVFGPRAVSLAGEWETHQFGADWVLTVQRDLPCRCASTTDGAQLMLLGFLVDPESPELNDQQLFERLRQARGWEELLRATENLSGRWAMFHLSQGRVRVFNDATGLRAVYYSAAGQEPWCFSQPGLYRHVQPIEYSPEALEFVRAKQIQKDWEACFPGASSPYREVAHLLPNHFLELPSRSITRFWPTAPLQSLDLDTAVGKMARLFQLSMQAITARGRAAFAVTAGRDSRTLLAASRAVTHRLWAYTALHGELNLVSPDLRIGTELCRIAGLTYHTLPCRAPMAEPFRRIFMQNNDPAHAVWGRICQGMLDGFPADMIAVRGNVSEAARCVFYPGGIHPATLDGNDLARRCKMPITEFTRRHFQAWLDEAMPSTELGYKALDLFFCENRMANWLAISQTEYDIIHDTFSPYSNRQVLNLMWSIPPALRIKPQSIMYRELIARMWPELSPFPFNPPDPLLARLLHKARKARGQIGACVGWRPVQVRLQQRAPQVGLGPGRVRP